MLVRTCTYVLLYGVVNRGLHALRLHVAVYETPVQPYTTLYKTTKIAPNSSTGRGRDIVIDQRIKVLRYKLFRVVYTYKLYGQIK